MEVDNDNGQLYIHVLQNNKDYKYEVSIGLLVWQKHVISLHFFKIALINTVQCNKTRCRGICIIHVYVYVHYTVATCFVARCSTVLSLLL